MTTPTSISMRERLRTNYAWTARQKQVLELIERGRSNTQIAEALGLSLAGAKWHVSEILSKLQADQREEAADYWRRYNGLAPRFERIFRSIAGAGALKMAAGVAGVAVLVGVAAVVAVAFNQASDEEIGNRGAADPIPTEAPPAPGVGTTLTLGDPADLPQGFTIYWSPKRQNSDGAGHRLFATDTDASGRATTRDVYPFLSSYPEAYVDQLLPEWRHGRLTVSVCVQGFCTQGGPGLPTEDARLLLMSSTDMGHTWVNEAELPRHSTLGGYVDGELLVTTVSLDAMGEETSPPRFWLHPSGRNLVPPPNLARPSAIATEGRLRWIDLERGGILYDVDGNAIGAAQPDIGLPAVDGSPTFTFESEPPTPQQRNPLPIIERSHNGERWTVPIEGSQLVPRWSIDGHRLMGNASVRESATGMPREYAVLIDLASATFHPLPALSEGIGDPLVTPMILGVRREP